MNGNEFSIEKQFSSYRNGSVFDCVIEKLIEKAWFNSAHHICILHVRQFEYNFFLLFNKFGECVHTVIGLIVSYEIETLFHISWYVCYFFRVATNILIDAMYIETIEQVKNKHIFLRRI